MVTDSEHLRLCDKAKSLESRLAAVASDLAEEKRVRKKRDDDLLKLISDLAAEQGKAAREIAALTIGRGRPQK